MGVLVTPHKELLSKLRFYQNAGGAVPSSFDCWLAQRGCKTLHLRLHQHGLNALAIARWLRKQDWVKEVIYPGLEAGHGEPNVLDGKVRRELAWKQLSPDAREKIESLGMDVSTGFLCGGM
jgi:cystathionine gamma-lyase